MTANVSTVSATVNGAPAGIVKALTMVANLFRRARNRRQVGSLADLTDAQLLDIGLTRGDLGIAFDTSVFDDPSLYLTKAARRRAESALKLP